MRQLLKAQHEQIEKLAYQLGEDQPSAGRGLPAGGKTGEDLSDPRTRTGSGLSGSSFGARTRRGDSPSRH